MIAIDRIQAIKYFEHRLIELQGYMICIKDEKERDKVFNKYKRFTQVLIDLKDEKEW